MATKSKPTINLGDEVERLKKELEAVTKLKDRILEDKRKVEAERDKLQQENMQVKKDSEGAYEKLKAYESGNQQKEGEIPSGYVEIATCPFSGNRAPQPRVNGLLSPRRIDEDGITYDVLPVKNAIALLNETSGWKRYLIGPCDSLCGQVPNGLYSKKVEFFRHKKRREDTGKWEFIRVYVEEPK
jgi:FtsZ-binding cell division protein ZapB